MGFKEYINCFLGASTDVKKMEKNLGCGSKMGF